MKSSSPVLLRDCHKALQTFQGVVARGLTEKHYENFSVLTKRKFLFQTHFMHDHIYIWSRAELFKKI